jgi:ABC-type Na+ efflux pump permease subunit
VERIYLRPDSSGLGSSAAFAMVYVVLMIGVSLIPNLMFEEKRTKTLDALLVSPASAGHVTIAKALVGVIYCLLGLAIASAINYTLIVQWWLVILAALGGALFAVAIGLMLGTLLESRQQLMIWAWVVILPLVIPLILSLVEELLPAWLVRICRALPFSSLFDLYRISFSNQATWGLWVPRLALLAAWAAPFLALVAWRVRRSDR